MDKHLLDAIKDAFKLAVNIVREPADAHDVMQDAATIALSHHSAPEFNSSAFKPWFYRVVRNKAIDKTRYAAKHRHEEFDDQSVSSSTLENPDVKLESLQLRQNIKEALAALSLEHREIVLLKDYHSFSYAEIAEILGIAKGSVMSRLHRARMALKAQLVALSLEEDQHE